MTQTVAPSDQSAAFGTFSALRFKHRIATSPLGGAAGALRGQWRGLRGLRNPELGLLTREDAMVNAVLQARIGAGWNCLDIGAHLGSVYYRLTRLAPRGQHRMIEASPGKAQMLRDRFGAEAVIECAVSDTEGEVTFHENLDQPGFSALDKRASRGRTVERRLRARRLDDILGDDTRVDFIKIDVEGHEYPALRGGEALLRRCRPLIQFEAGARDDADLAGGPDDPAAPLFHWLTDDLGYAVYAAFDLHYGRPAIDAAQFASYRSYPYMAFNYFAVHPQHLPPATSAPRR